MKKRLKKYFVPHKENDYKPHILRPKAIALACLVIIVAESAYLVSSKYIIPRSKLFGIVVANTLIDETNESRVSNNLPPLQENALLDAAAQDKANDMVKNNYFAHTSPAGLTPWYWFQAVGYSFDYAGENLAVNFSNSQDVTNAWMNSPEHRANILDADYTQIGMATAQGTFQGSPATYVVELFGTPAPTPVAESVIPGIASAQAAAPAGGQAVTSTSGTGTTGSKPSGSKTGGTTVTSKPTSTATNTSTNQVSISTPNIATQTPTSVAITQGNASPSTTVETTTPQHATSVVLGFVSSDNNAPMVHETNAIQQLFSEPETLANDLYIFFMILFGAALIINVFVKIRVQYPKLIFGALLVIVVAGLAVMLNQSAAAHIAIL